LAWLCNCPKKYTATLRKKLVLVGLGYVGLPIAIEFGKKLSAVSSDIDQSRINDL